MTRTNGPRRRTVLGSIALAGALGLAGCSADISTGEDAEIDANSSESEVPAGLWPAARDGQREVMLLGTYHFAGSDGDVFSAEADVLTEENQSQLDALTDRFVDWEPDAIAVEATPERQDAVDAAYEAWLDDDLDALPDGIEAKNEIVQVAARLGEKLDRDGLVAVDHRRRLDALLTDEEREQVGGLRDYLPNPDEVDYPLFDAEARFEERQEKRAASTQTEYFRYLNRRSQRTFNDDLLYAMAFEESDVGEYTATKVLTAWYQRNLRIAANLWNRTAADDERILLLIGASHVPTLRHMLNQAPMFSPVSPLPYLE